MIEIKHKDTGEIIRTVEAENLREADLRWANLRWADLREADLRWANLRWANLHGANVLDVHWPAPTMILLASWHAVEDELIRDLMVFDGWCHPDPTAFDRWADGGICPYDDAKVQRAANFRERKELWPRGEKTPRSPLELADRLLVECCKGHEPWTEYGSMGVTFGIED